MIKFHIITLFPEMFDSYLNESILARAIKNRKIAVKFYNPRDFVKPTKVQAKKNRPYLRIDDKPYGGGPGMVIQAMPVIKAVESAVRGSEKGTKPKIIWLSPSGKQFSNVVAQKFSKNSDLIIISGRYEGIDARVKKIFKVEELSIGPFVVTGGELPAMVIIDSISRRIPGVLGDNSSIEESRAASSDVYTRPETLVYKEKKYVVPKVLLSGDHKK